jgi:replicative DNA helicase
MINQNPEDRIDTRKILDAGLETMTRYNRPEIEQVTLGCLLLGRTFDFNPFDLTVDDFTTIVHHEVFSFICDYFRENGCNPDLVTAWSYFKAQEKKYHTELCEMIDVAVTPSLYPQYCAQLRQMTIERKTAEAYWHWQEGRLEFEEYQEKIKSLELSGKPIRPWKEILKDFSESLSGKRPKPKAYLTPFEGFNEKTGGFLAGELILVGGRSGKGKTGLLCNFAIDSAVRGYSVAFLSLEMSAFAILARFFGSELNINTKAFRLADLTKHEQAVVGQQILDWADLKIFVEDRRISHLRDIERIIRDNKPEVVIIDYIQRLYSGRSENRNQELDFIINRLKSLAIRQQCVVIAAAQLGRQAEGKENAQISDLRDSGSLEQTGDVVILMNPREDKKDEAIIQLDVAKSRHTGRFKMTVSYHKAYQKFKEIENESLY